MNWRWATSEPLNRYQSGVQSPFPSTAWSLEFCEGLGLAGGCPSSGEGILGPPYNSLDIECLSKPTELNVWSPSHGAIGNNIGDGRLSWKFLDGWGYL